MLGRALGAKILDIYNRAKVIILSLTIVLAATILLPFSTTLIMFLLVAVMLGIGWAFLYPALTIHAIEKAGLAQGPAMGTFTAIADLGSGLGPMIMGYILERTSYPIMFACLIVTATINFLYFYWFIGKKGGMLGKRWRR